MKADQQRCLWVGLVLTGSLMLLRPALPQENQLAATSRWSSTHCASPPSSTFSASQRLQFRPSSPDLTANPVLQYFSSQDMSSLESHYLQQFSPWLVLAILVFLGLLYGIAFVTLGFKPLCLYRNRDYKKKPVQKGELIYPVVALLAFSLLTLGVSISGAVYSQRVPPFVQEMQCQLASAVETTLQGQTSSQGFQGLDTLQAQFVKISQELKTNVDTISAKTSSQNWVTTDGDALKAESLEIYNKHRNTLILKPNPALISQSGVQTRQYSYFLQNYLGPASNSDTLLYALDKDVLNDARMVADLTANLKVSLGQVDSALSSSAMQTALDKASAASQSLQTEVQQLKVTLQGLLQNVDGHAQLVSAATGLLVVSALVACFSLAVSVMVFTCKAGTTTSNKMRRLFHALWILLSLVAVAMLLVVGGLWAVSGAVYDTCLASDHLLGNSVNFAKYPKVFSSQVNADLPVCLWENDGKLQRNLGVEAELNQIGEMTSSYANFLEYLSPGQPKYLDLNTQETAAFAKQLARVEEYILGSKVRLYGETSVKEDNPVESLQQLNFLSDKSQSYAPNPNCAPSQDFYVYDPKDCPPNYQVFNNNTHTISFNYGSQTCVPVQQLTKNNFQSRHASYQSVCNSQYSSMYNYYYAVYNFDQSNREAFSALKASLSAYQSHSSAYLGKVGTAYSELSSVRGQSEPFVSFLNTLLGRLNCNFLQAHLQASLDLLCIGVGENLYRTVSLMTICALSLLVSTVLAYVFATRFDKFRVVKMNPSKNIYLRKSKRLSVSQVQEVSDLEKDDSQLQPQHLQLTHFQSKPSLEAAPLDLSQHTEDIREEQHPPYESVQDRIMH